MAQGGRLAKVMYGSVVIAGMGTWSMTGFTPKLDESTAFGDTVESFVEAGIGNAGEVSFDGFYDGTDTNGQVALLALQNTGSHLTNLYFYESTSCFWRVQSGGYIMLSKFEGPKFGKNQLATINFSGKISTKPMEKVGTSVAS